MVSFVVALIALGAGVIALTRVGSLTEAFGLQGSDLVGENQQAQSGQVTTDNLQSNPSIPIPQGSQTTVATVQSSQILRTDIRSKQKLNSSVSKPMIKTTFFNPKEGGLDPQAGILVSTNSSLKNTVLGLNQKQIGELRSQPFTKQEQQDIINLTERFNRKSTSSQKVSDSPQEIIFKKREQDAIARQVLGGSNFITSGGSSEALKFGVTQKGGLFGKKNFAFGGVSEDVFLQQRADRALIFKKLEENRALNEQREVTGNQIISTINKSGMNQKQFLLSAGIALRGQDLNPRAIAKLREKGLI